MKQVFAAVLIACLAQGVRAEASSDWYLYWSVDFTESNNNPLQTGETMTLWLEANGVKSKETFEDVTSKTGKITIPSGTLISQTTYIGKYESQPTVNIQVMIGDYATGSATYMTTLTSDMYDKYVGKGTSPTSGTLNVAAGTWSVVPEPTGGLLTLLGLAALALRRRSPRTV